MASKRYTPPAGINPGNEHLYAAFMKDLLAGNVQAVKLTETLAGTRVVRFDYDEPAAGGGSVSVISADADLSPAPDAFPSAKPARKRPARKAPG